MHKPDYLARQAISTIDKQKENVYFVTGIFVTYSLIFYLNKDKTEFPQRNHYF